MSPAKDEEVAEDQKIFALAKGFDALLEITQKLTNQERQLQNRLQFAYDEYLKLANQLSSPPNNHETNVAEQIIHSDYFNNGDRKVASDVRGWIRDVEDSGYITDSDITAVVEGVDICRSLASKQDDKAGYPSLNNCFVAANAQERARFESDFTTKGVNGKLQCPFAKPNGNNQGVGQVEDGLPETCGNDDLDPIKAEFHCGRPSNPSVSGQSAGTAARCPIRYLHKHTPEELAKYFENHKHEIPRSHAVCIQRYQRDSQSRRQLDEKYGDLTTMVKGLGQYHRPYLPTQGGPDQGQSPGPASVARVEKWAEGVDAKSSKGEAETHPSVKQDGAHEEDGRRNQFERPLRDIRVGESPSRPWGIHVPPSQPVPQTSVHSPAIPVTGNVRARSRSRYDKCPFRPTPVANASVDTPDPAPAGADRCPFQPDKDTNATEGLKTPQAEPWPGRETQGSPQLHGHRTSSAKPVHGSSHGKSQTSNPSGQRNVVFNAPVFFGYSAESTALLLDKLGTSRGN